MDRPTDELVHRLLTAMSALGGAHAERLIDQARTEAEAEVKDLLKSAMKAVLLRRAVDQLESAKSPPDQAPEPEPPPPPAPDASTPSASYVYAITRTTWGTPPQN